MPNPFILLINPWIYDFAAYDLWVKPLGLLYIAAVLKRNGFGLHLIDCLDPYNPKMQEIYGVREDLAGRNWPWAFLSGTGCEARKIKKNY